MQKHAVNGAMPETSNPGKVWEPLPVLWHLKTSACWKPLAKAPCTGKKMWDRTDRTSKFLSRIAYINFDGFQSMTWAKCIRPSRVANNPFLPTLEAGAPLETTFPEIPEAPLTAKSLLLHMVISIDQSLLQYNNYWILHIEVELKEGILDIFSVRL